MGSNEYPIIKFSNENLGRDSESWLSTCNTVKKALEDYGFFVLVQTGLFSEELNTGIYQAMEKLFSLPVEVKKRNKSDTIFYFGYQGPSSTRPLRESMSIENCTSAEAVESFAKLMWPPSGNNHFCGMVNLYAKKALEMRQLVSRMVFESYGLEKYYESHNEAFMDVIRLNKYRPPADSKDSDIGVPAHTDTDWLGTVYQINQVNSLQIKPKGGDHWVTVDIPPLSLVVFAGESLSAWSNGRIHAVEHQVMMRGREARYSLATFSFLTNKPVQVPEELVDEDHPLLYKPFDDFGLMRFFATAEGQRAENLLQAYCGVQQSSDQP